MQNSVTRHATSTAGAAFDKRPYNRQGQVTQQAETGHSTGTDERHSVGSGMPYNRWQYVMQQAAERAAL